MASEDKRCCDEKSLDNCDKMSSHECDKIMKCDEKCHSSYQISCGPEDGHDHDRHEHHHGDGCCCGHDHDHHHEDGCCCGHDHDHHHEDGCCCGHDHDHHHEDGCCCGHDHGSDKGIGARTILKYILGSLPIIAAFIPVIPLPVRVVLAVAAYLVFGFDVWKDMIRGFGRKKIFTEFTLMCVASVGAFAIGEFADAAAVMYLYSLGEMLSDSAYSKSKKNISDLLAIKPEYATVIRDGKSMRVSPEDVEVGETLIAVSGERIPIDSVVIEGNADADTSSVTGESVPLALYSGVSCPSGSVVIKGTVTLRAVSDYDNSVVAGLTRAVNEASRRKATAEKKIARFAGIFTPIAFLVAFAVALVGSLVTRDVLTWIKAGLIVLVVSCPCSLVISVPLTYFAGIGSAATCGIVFKGGEVMDSLKRIKAVVFDKTGTLTESGLSFVGAEVYGNTNTEDFLDLAQDVLTYSPHAAAVAFCDQHRSASVYKIENAENVAGRGISCLADGKTALFGNGAFMRENGIQAEDSKGSAIYGALDGVLIGRLDFSAALKKSSAEAVTALKKKGMSRIAVISGDGEDAVKNTCAYAGIDEFYWSVTPSGKSLLFDRIQSEVKGENRDATVAFCGDGLNDSAVIAMADVGVAMGDSGAALTAESADVVLMDGDPMSLCRAIDISKRTSRIATQNIIISLGIKIAVFTVGVIASATGAFELPLEVAIVADVGAAVITVLNSLRATYRRCKNETRK